jgi:hypothetical protein
VIDGLQQQLAGHEARQGLLVGQIANDATHISDSRPLPSLDPAAIVVAAPSDGSEIVGYYRIRDGSAFILSPAEVAFTEGSFKRPGAVTLLVERRPKGAAEATFYFWRGDVFVHNLPLPFPFDSRILSGETPRALAAATLGGRMVRAASSPARRNLRRVLIAAVVIIAGGGLVASLRDGPLPGMPLVGTRPPPATPSEGSSVWISTEPRRDIEIAWDPRTSPLATATAGMLKIEDGGSTRQMSLDLGELLMGAIVYAPATSRIRVELTALQRDGSVLPAPVSARGIGIAAAKPVTSSTVPPSTSPAPLGEDLPAPDPASRSVAANTAKPETPVAPQVVPPVQQQRPLKRFTFNSAERTVTTTPQVVLDPPLHQAPLPNTGATLNAALPPSSFGVPTAPPPPPVANPAPVNPAASNAVATNPAPVTATPANSPAPSNTVGAPARPGPRAGRLIWVGTLDRFGVIELDGRQSSVGSVNGALPSVPVTLSIKPAEFTKDGLVVYTSDATRHNRVEFPNAANGWNKTTFVWDPERVKQIEVLESPNQANGFNRLALRSGAKRTSMLIIEWTAR